MDRIRDTFKRLRRARQSALIPFIMGGDPDCATTAALLIALQEAGADLIEVGIPFSDPLADGPVIQASTARALARGATPERVLRAIASVRHRLSIPVLCLSYWNPIVQFHAKGAAPTPELFLKRAAASGVSGLIVPDLPVEEGAALRVLAARQGIDTVFLAAPTSPPERLRAIARASEGFIYYVSVAGTTGVRHTLPEALAHGVRQLRLLTTKPICVGFGISTPGQAAAVAKMADGVIIGSALIRAIQSARGGRAAQVHRARSFIKQLRQVL